MAFKLVVTLDLKRRENDAKVDFKSVAYEGLLAEHGARFSEYEAKIQRALAIHTTFAIESLHDKFEEQKTTLQEMRNGLRKEIRDIIDSRGGTKACINDNTVFQILLDKSGEDIVVLGRPDTDLSQTKQSLLKELAENVDEALRQNFALFQGKLEIQKQELDTIIRQGDRIMAFLSGYERICDRVC
ncbi:hypothetical protein C0995_015380 [Termitomyces sp. Mi166|nr:hypothetical protein C0995_015380 [Termitomyces sp. Mi166\